MGDEMPKTNARKNIHNGKQAKMPAKNQALKETMQGPLKDHAQTCSGEVKITG
jgi:hypothetical protein